MRILFNRKFSFEFCEVPNYSFGLAARLPSVKNLGDIFNHVLFINKSYSKYQKLLNRFFKDKKYKLFYLKNKMELHI